MSVLTRTIANTASKVLFRSAEVTGSTDYGPHFRAIQLSGASLRRANWNPGDKIQVRSGPDGLIMRTYTPTSWDTTKGWTRILIYAHGTGPGSEWGRAAADGLACQFFGPRSSLRFDGIDRPIVFVGDETSFGLVAAWQTNHQNQQPAAALFEVSDPDESAGILDVFEIEPSCLVSRTAASTHLDDLASQVTDTLRTSPGAALCLTGKAQTIAVLRRAIKSAGLEDRPTRVKAYWDEHRVGLD